MKKIGILTSGGDCGGLNAVIKGAALMANQQGVSCYVIPNGYAGLYNLVDFDKLVELTPSRADLIDSNLAGSEAGHSRVKIKKIEDPKKYERIKQGLKKFELDGLVISGGDDTGSVMMDLSQQGIKCVHAPKTMDLDLQCYSVGGDSTINRIATFGEELKTTGNTHNRILALGVFGRYAGHTAFRGGIAADADAVLIPEIPVDFDILFAHAKARFFKRIENNDLKRGTYLIVVAEGLKDASGQELYDETAGIDAFGHKKLTGAADYVCQELKKRFKVDGQVKDFMKEQKMYVQGIYDFPEIRGVEPGHLVRSGHSSAYDVNFGKEAGAAAVLLLLKGISGVTVTGIEGQKIHYCEISEIIKPRHVDMNLITFYENLGVCFGRKPSKLQPEFEKIHTPIKRHL